MPLRTAPLRSISPLKRSTGIRSLSALKTVTTLRRKAPKQARPKDTGFTQAVKLAVRTRAGDGDPEMASCEACGRFLGSYGGQVHHRQTRQSGGSKLRNGICNAGLLCGTPDDFATCHGKATRGDLHMKGAGWLLVSGQNPATEPVMLFGSSGGGVGVTVWLAADGTYALEAPKGAAA